MYKSLSVLMASAFMLTACNSNETEKNDEQPAQTEQSSQTEQKEVEAHDHEKHASLPEYDTIIEQIGNKDYTFNKETDNDDKRVFLIELDGEKQYKTIFVKQTKRLKIVKINGGGEIFNKTI